MTGHCVPMCPPARTLLGNTQVPFPAQGFADQLLGWTVKWGAYSFMYLPQEEGFGVQQTPEGWEE